MTALTLGTSLLVHGNIISGSRVVFYLPWIFKFPLPEVWRFVTPFWVTGGGLSILFDTYFCEPHGTLYKYSSYSSTIKYGRTRAALRRSPTVSPNRETSSPISFSSASQSWYVFSHLFPSACLLLPGSLCPTSHFSSSYWPAHLTYLPAQPSSS